MLLMFNSDRFDVNNTNNKISTVISWIKDRVFVNSSDNIHYAHKSIKQPNISELSYRPKSIDSNLSI